MLGTSFSSAWLGCEQRILQECPGLLISAAMLIAQAILHWISASCHLSDLSQIFHAFGRSASRQEIVPRRINFDDLTIRITFYHVHLYTLLLQSLTITFWWFWAVSLAVAVQVAGNGTFSANLPVAATGSDSHTINEKNRRTHQEPRANGLSNFNFSLALPALLRWGPMAKQLFLSLHTSQQLCYLFFYVFLPVPIVISFSFCGNDKLHCLEAHCCCTVCDKWVQLLAHGQLKLCQCLILIVQPN